VIGMFSNPSRVACEAVAGERHAPVQVVRLRTQRRTYLTTSEHCLWHA
jgi:hypothetical protein